MQQATPIPSEREFDAVAERFFSRPPAAWEIEHDDWQPEPMSSVQRMAMMTTVAPAMAIFAVAITLLSGSLLGALPLPLSQPSVVRLAAPALAAVVTRQNVSTEPVSAVAPVPARETRQQAVTVPAIAASARSVAQPVSRRAPKNDSGAKRARKLLDAGDARAARDLAREVVRGAPDRAAGYIVLAAALDKLGDRVGMNAIFQDCAKRATDPLASACKSLARRR